MIIKPMSHSSTSCVTLIVKQERRTSEWETACPSVCFLCVVWAHTCMFCYLFVILQTHACPATSGYTGCAWRDKTNACRNMFLDLSACPVNLPYSYSFIGSVKFWFTTVQPACLPSPLSGWLCVHISGSSKMISCFRLASKLLSQPWLSVC